MFFNFQIAKTVNTLRADAELCLRVAEATKQLRTMERRKVEYKRRVRCHVEDDKRAKLAFMMHIVAANDLITFLKRKLHRVAA